MKKAKYIIAFTLLIVISFSCSESFFDKKPLGSTSETVFYNEKGIESLLIGVYALVGGGIQNSSGGGSGWGSSATNWTFGSAASDDAYKGSDEGDQATANEVERWNILPNNDYPQGKWKWYLMGVTRINSMLKVLKGTEGLTPATATHFEAQAKFLRAWFNFEGYLVFKNIVILTEDTPDPTAVPNTEPVIPAIVEDLTFAIINLPATQADKGRPTKWAAMALLARVHLNSDPINYAAAKPLLDNIISTGPFSLVPNFFDNYRIATEHNAESIFEIERSVNNGSGYGSYTGEIGIGLNWPHGSDIGMCCGFHQSSQNLVNAYKVDANGLPMFTTFNDVDLKSDQGVPSASTFVPFTDEVDPRLDWTVSRRGIPYMDWGVNRGRDWIRNQNDGGPYMPAPKWFIKKSERATLGDQTGGWMSGVNANNWRAIRYAHVLLWRAEVAVSENTPASLAYAEQLVNMVRVRAANEKVMGRVTTYELPPSAYPFNVSIDYLLPAANYKVSPYPVGTFATQAYALRAVQWELRLEFAMEGHRFFDLRRWGIIKQTLDAFAIGDLRTRQFMKNCVFTDRAKWAPLPQTQLDLEPDVLVQNPGY
jgi:starch-binding outer membrane protein, SusD/RagB family